MKSYREGEWTVTTPLYIGIAPEVEKAQTCSHRYVEGVRQVEQGQLLVHERCTGCVATRAKYRPATADEMKTLCAGADGTGVEGQVRT